MKFAVIVKAYGQIHFMHIADRRDLNDVDPQVAPSLLASGGGQSGGKGKGATIDAWQTSHLFCRSRIRARRGGKRRGTGGIATLAPFRVARF